MNNPSKHRRLMQRDREILNHIARFRVTTNEVVHHLFFAQQRANAVTKVTARLVSSTLLRRFPLYHPQKYFRLGPAGASLLGLSENRTLPLGPQSLPTEFGVLSYATRGRRYHQRLTREEVAKQYPFFIDGLIEQAYTMVDETLELVRVDLGGAADHVARKCQRDIELRMDLPEFAAFLQSGKFRLVVVTCTTEKAAAIQNALDRHQWPDGLTIHLAVVSDLITLTASLSHAS